MTAFDPIAPHYDRDFTLSRTGILQRHSVRKYLDAHLPVDRSLQVLELGCGTGEDALYLARKGHRVLATDISAKMIEVARAKAGREKYSGEVHFEVADMRDLKELGLEQKFDLVFSNFGALNCLPPREMKNLFMRLENAMAENGRFIAVLMPSFCLWESMYFIVKERWSSAFRRWKRDGVPAGVGGEMVQTWYYSPHEMIRMARDHFGYTRKRPVGFFLPPSYLDDYFSRNRRWLNFLDLMENGISELSLLSGLSDHFIIEMKSKQ